MMLSLIFSGGWLYIYEGDEQIYANDQGYENCLGVFGDAGTQGWHVGARKGDLTTSFNGEISNLFFASPAPSLDDIVRIHAAATIDHVKLEQISGMQESADKNSVIPDHIFYLDGLMDLTDGTCTTLRTLSSAAVVNKGTPALVTSPHGTALDLATDQYYTAIKNFPDPYHGWDNRGYSRLYATFSLYFKPNYIPAQKATLFTMMSATGMRFGIENYTYWMTIDTNSPTESISFDASGFQVGQWTQLTVMIDAKTVTIYEADVMVASKSNVISWTNFWLGRVGIGDPDGARPFDGQVASFHVFNHGSSHERPISEFVALQQYKTESYETGRSPDNIVTTEFAIYSYNFGNYRNELSKNQDHLLKIASHGLDAYFFTGNFEFDISGWEVIHMKPEMLESEANGIPASRLMGKKLKFKGHPKLSRYRYLIHVDSKVVRLQRLDLWLMNGLIPFVKSRPTKTLFIAEHPVFGTIQEEVAEVKRNGEMFQPSAKLNVWEEYLKPIYAKLNEVRQPETHTWVRDTSDCVLSKLWAEIYDRLLERGLWRDQLVYSYVMQSFTHKVFLVKEAMVYPFR